MRLWPLGVSVIAVGGVQLYFGVITQAKDRRSDDEHISFLLCYNDIRTANYSKTAHVSLSVSIVTTRQAKRWFAETYNGGPQNYGSFHFFCMKIREKHTHTPLAAGIHTCCGPRGRVLMCM